MTSSLWRPLCLLITLLVLCGANTGCADFPIHFQSPVILHRVLEKDKITAIDVNGREQFPVNRNTDLMIKDAPDKHQGRLVNKWLKDEERERLTASVEDGMDFCLALILYDQATLVYSASSNTSFKAPTSVRQIARARLTIFKKEAVVVIRAENKLVARTISSVEDWIWNPETMKLERLDRVAYQVQHPFGEDRPEDMARSLPLNFRGTLTTKSDKLVKDRFDDIQE